MNKYTEITREIVDNATANLKELGYLNDIKIVKSKDGSYDFYVIIDGNKFISKAKTNVTQSNFGLILNQLKQIEEKKDYPILLVAKSISPHLISEFLKNNINTLDIYGNASIINDNFKIVIKGEKNKQQKTELTKSDRLFKEAGLKLIFGLLTNSEIINYTYREMQEFVDLSLGAIKNGMEAMTAHGYLIKTENKRILKKRDELIQRWIISYNEVLKPKLFLKKMSFKNNIQWKEIKLPDNTYWGGEPASNLLNGFLIPEDFTMYTEEKTGQLVRSGLRPDENGNVFVYKKIWKSNNSDNFVPKLLIYADLMGSGNNRNIEAAQRIADNGL